MHGGDDSRGAGAPRTSGSYGAGAGELEQLRLPRDEGGAIAGARRRRWPLRLGLGLLALGLAVVAWRLTERATPVEVVQAVALADVAGEPVPVLSGSGYVVPAQPFIAIGSRIAGRVERYLVEEGDRVLAGQPLVELDATPFRATSDQVRASLRSARAQRDLAEAELARAQELIDRGVLSREEYERRESEARVARARVAELEAALERSETDLADTVIRAPTDGVVLETYKQPGEIAVPGGFSGSGDLLRLANLAELRAELDVNEADLPRVSLGQQAEIVPDAFPEQAYAGRVVKLAPQIDRQKGTREVEVVVLDPDERLLPDMSVRVVFFAAFGASTTAGEASDVSSPQSARGAVVPRAALRRDAAGRPFVWVARDGRAARVGVDVGETLGDRIVVTSGLRGGESVILGAAPEREGEAVRIADAPDAA